jgi:hypothetical protein
LQVCCYWMTCIDSFEIYWQAWFPELNLQLAVLSESVLYSGRPFAQVKTHRNPHSRRLFQAKNVPSAKPISIKWKGH